jgi:hypothetical protein
MKSLRMYSSLFIVSIIVWNAIAIGTIPAQAATASSIPIPLQNDTGVQAGGTPFTDGVQAFLVAQVTVETTVKTYKDFPLLTFQNETNMTGLNFSSFWYTFHPSPSIENVSFGATGGTCSQTDRTIRCTGRITAFHVSYIYYADAEVSENAMSIVESFRTNGFTYSGVFTTIYQPRLFHYKTSTRPVQNRAANSFRWRTSSSTAYAANTITFDLNCVLINYKASHFRGPVVVGNVDFITNLNKINQAAINSDVLVEITGSRAATFRIHGSYVPGAIAPPAARSNHLVGHAIDMNVLYGAGYVRRCNSTCLLSATRPPVVTDFINAVKAAGLRWGGNFPNDIDPVHFDDNYYRRSPAQYAEQFVLAQSNPSCRLGYSLNP